MRGLSHGHCQVAYECQNAFMVGRSRHVAWVDMHFQRPGIIKHTVYKWPIQGNLQVMGTSRFARTPRDPEKSDGSPSKEYSVGVRSGKTTIRNFASSEKFKNVSLPDLTPLEAR